jgi:hypothetical protein
MSFKASNLKITKEFLDKRSNNCIAKGFSKQKWIFFCEDLLAKGYSLELYEARRTFSKYITINGSYKVRFSNHKPLYNRELNKDCDYFVGVTHTGIRTTEDALQAVDKYFLSKESDSVLLS